MIYAAASPSLAVLEVLVHLDLSPDLIPADYRLLSIEVPDDCPGEMLPRTPDTPQACVVTGDAFLVRGAALFLSVESVIVPQERNALINPAHADATRLATVADVAFNFDPRLLDATS
ncbi:MAG: hypothetical protein JWP35_4039 [Caulobacter sp.]|nr:hypothetical protein [Caulobacter sp.]